MLFGEDGIERVSYEIDAFRDESGIAVEGWTRRSRQRLLPRPHQNLADRQGEVPRARRDGRVTAPVRWETSDGQKFRRS